MHKIPDIVEGSQVPIQLTWTDSADNDVTITGMTVTGYMRPRQGGTSREITGTMTASGSVITWTPSIDDSKPGAWIVQFEAQNNVAYRTFAATLTVRSYPATELILVDELRAYLRIGGNDADPILQTLIESAQQWVAVRLGMSFKIQTFQDVIQSFDDHLTLSVAPVIDVESILDLKTDEYIDVEGLYIVPPRRVYGQSFASRYQVDYHAGTETMDAGIRQSILMLAARAFENRDGRASEGVSNAGQTQWQSLYSSDIDDLLFPYREMTC